MTFKSSKKQTGASAPLVLIILGMAAVMLTIAFKLYPPIFENWQVEAVVSSFEDDNELEELTVSEIQKRFTKRLAMNNVRDFNAAEGLFITKDDDLITIEVSYEVRVPMYRNIDAVIKFEKLLEKNY